MLKLASGGAGIELKGGNITVYAPSGASFKAVQKKMTGAQGGDHQPPSLPKGGDPKPLYAAHFQIKDEDGQPMARHRYVMKTPDGKQVFGLTDAEGRTHTVNTADPAPVSMYPIHSNDWDEEVVNVDHLEYAELWEKD
jgi:uncharacterized protein (DUF2345 family)